VMDTYKDIAKDFKEIYERLDYLIKKKVHVIIALGNHEISTRKPYEKKFKRRKNKMIRKFQRKKLRNEFLKRENMCQYIILRKNENEQLEMVTYDSKMHIDKIKIVKKETLGNIPNEGPLKGRYKCILTHGFQFEPKKYSFFALIWAFILKTPGFIKELFDILWNGIIKTPERPVIEQIDKAEFKRRIKENKDMLNKKQKISYFLFKRLILKELVKEAKHKAAIKDNREFNNVIKESYIDDFLKLGITHIIYGHSHTKQDDITINGVPVLNPGGWQQVSEPGFIEIHSNGDIKVKTYTQKEEKSTIEA
ncbi:MAG: hypothetical protein ACFFDK_08975, partial [Promethearchaeota archaeon]